MLARGCDKQLFSDTRERRPKTAIKIGPNEYGKPCRIAAVTGNRALTFPGGIFWGLGVHPQKDRSRRITVGADKAYDTKDFVRTARELNVTPHVTKNDKGRSSNLDRRTTRHAGYAISLSRRWLVEKGFGWLKQTGPLR